LLHLVGIYIVVL